MKLKKKVSLSLKHQKNKLAKQQSGHKKISKRLVIGIAILFIMLFVIVVFSSQQQILRGNAAQPITPTYGSIGDCTANQNCPSGATTGGQQTSVSPGTSAAPSSSVSQITSPCISSQNAQVNTMSKRRYRSSGSQGGFQQLLLQFLQMILQLLQQLLGGGNISIPGIPSGTPSVAPGQGVTPSGTPITSPSPCPPSTSPSSGTTQPSATMQPSASQPTASSAPSGTSSNVMPVGVSGNWTLTFDDEFNGSAVDTSKWTVEGPRAPNNDQEYACYSPAAVTESGGSLNLALLNTSCSVGGTTYQYTGAQMDTEKEFTQTYGYYEARIWSDGSNGTVANWGGWWLVGTTWPEGGEVDIFEGFHGSAGYHFEYAPSGTAIWQGAQASGDYTGWHTYGVNWQPNSLTFYYDGKEMDSYSTGVPTVAKHLMVTYSNGPLNNVGGPVKVPATEKFDYVRVWK